MEREMSNNFYHALGNTDLDESIRLYTIEIEKIDSTNFAAWNNRGHDKVKKAELTKDKALIDDAIKDFKKAIELANEKGSEGFTGAENNIKWATKVAESF